MSYVHTESLRPAELVALYVLQCRGQALFLPYRDYALIDEWLQRAAGLDELLLILAEVLPPYFGGASRGGAKSLAGVHKLVLSRLHDLKMHQPRGGDG